MSDGNDRPSLHDKWRATPEGRAAYTRARKRIKRHRRFYAHWERVKRRLRLGETIDREVG